MPNITLNKKLPPNHQLSLQVITYCPLTGEQVIGNLRRHFKLSSAELTWWRCPDCQTWHAAIVDALEENTPPMTPHEGFS